MNPSQPIPQPTVSLNEGGGGGGDGQCQHGSLLPRASFQLEQQSPPQEEAMDDTQKAGGLRCEVESGENGIKPRREKFTFSPLPGLQ